MLYLDYKNYKTNRQILDAQLKTNQEIGQLKLQMQQANDLNNQILINQIRDIEERETQKYYKALSFKMNQLIDTIDTVQDTDLKAFLYGIFDYNIQNSLSESIGVLNELQDKDFCTKMRKDYLQKKATAMSANLSIATDLETINNNKEEYNSIYEEYNKAKDELADWENTTIPTYEPAKSNGEGGIVLGIILIIIGVFCFVGFSKFIGVCGILFGLFMLLGGVFNIKDTKKVNETNDTNFKAKTKEKEENIARLNQTIVELEEKLSKTPYNIAFNNIMSQHPNWKSSVDESFKISQ